MPGPGIAWIVSKGGHLGLSAPCGHRRIGRVTVPVPAGVSQHLLSARTAGYPWCRFGAASAESHPAPLECGCRDSGDPKETERIEIVRSAPPAFQTTGP